MRKAGRVVVLFVLSLLSAAVLGAVTALIAAVSLAATALIVPGTGTPNANNVNLYMPNFRDYYMRDTPCTEADGCGPYNPVTGQGLLGVNYPASFWPIPLPGWCPNLSCDKFDVSVAKGVQNLDVAVLQHLGFGDQIVIAGYSQGARVVSIEKMKFGNGEYGDLTDRVSFVEIGNPNRPNGGLLSRLGILGTIPILDVTTGQPTPTDTGYKTEDWAIRWEGIADFPLYLFNPLAVVNSLLGFYYDHGTYLARNGGSDPGELPAGYTEAQWREITAHPELYPDIVDIQTYEDTTYYTVTPKVLPLVRPLHGIPLIGKPIADLIEPALRVIIEETGYNRNIPFGQPAGIQLIPIFNPITLVLKLIPAIFQGVNRPALLPELRQPPRRAAAAVHGRGRLHGVDAPAAGRCRRGRATAASEQRFAAGTTLIAGVATLVLAIGVGVMIGQSGDNSTPAGRPPAPQIIKVGRRQR